MRFFFSKEKWWRYLGVMKIEGVLILIYFNYCFCFLIKIKVYLGRLKFISLVMKYV